MKMNLIEKLAMNNPIRGMIQQHIEMPLLKKLGGKLEGQHILEIGCGRGVGTQLIFEQLEAEKVTATDFDETMLKKAKARLKNIDSNKLNFQVADVTQLDFEDNSYDAIVNFGAIHHVQNWQTAIAEIKRVLKPGGRFYFLEVTKQWISRWPYSKLFKHPKENRFSSHQFIIELQKNGLDLGSNWIEKAKGDFIFGVAQSNS